MLGLVLKAVLFVQKSHSDFDLVSKVRKVNVDEEFLNTSISLSGCIMPTNQ